MKTIDRVWDILVAHGGADEELREPFRQYISGWKSGYYLEFRFQGIFGFGGKIRYDGSSYRMDYYPEDRTASRSAAMEKINGLLSSLR